MLTLDPLRHLKKNQNRIKIFSISLFTLLISACSQTNVARIKDLSDSSSTYSQSRANITRVKTDTVKTQITKTQITKNGDAVVNTTQEQAIYSRNYDDIPKGGYKGNRYTVKRGDTLFYIAWITGNDFRSLAAKNSVKEPYVLKVGQVLDVGDAQTVAVTKGAVTKQAVTRQAITKPNSIKPVTTATTISPTVGANNRSTPSVITANIKWHWPAKGKIIESFSNATKGIDIAGSLGDKIVAAADGRVVYTGNALPGYGNLIIIKHNDDYLTAYAHNQGFLVKEQQEVKAGEQIATMGNTGTRSVRLHFEIRYKAKSVNPVTYLPKR